MQSLDAAGDVTDATFSEIWKKKLLSYIILHKKKSHISEGKFIEDGERKEKLIDQK